MGVYIKSSLSFQPLPELSTFIPRMYESQFFKIEISKKQYIILGNIYRPNTAPYANIHRFNEILKETLQKIKSNAAYKNLKDIVICGDVNIDLLKTTSHDESANYLDNMFENGLLPLINLPTRIGLRSASIIDHISTSIIDDSYDAGIIISDISDHFPVFYVKYFTDPKEKSNIVKKRSMNDNNKQEFISILQNNDWSNVLNNNNPETAFEHFFSFISDSFEKCFPEKFVTQRNQRNKSFNSPWMTTGLLESRKNKQKLFSKKMRKPCPENIQRFKDYNNLYTRLIRKAKHQYFNDKFLQFTNNSKKTWQTINEVLGRNKNVSDIPNTFISNENVLSSDFEIAEGFNKFFANIGPKLASNIPQSNKQYAEFLSEPCNQNFVFANVNSNIVEAALSKLKSKNSCGLDNISTNLLKFISPAIMRPMTHLFNLSFKTGYIPTCLKTAVIKPIFKNGHKENFTNYRPISLLSSFSKVMEKIAANQMMKYLNKYKLLYEHQYGFRSNHSTEQPVLHFIDKIYKALNESKFTLSIFIDLTKAFDTCNFDILLDKLNYYGFRGISNVWFKNYLTGRKQTTCIRGVNSSFEELQCGVPQGSILGPILFILLINDLPNASKFFSLLYADDTTLQMTESDLQLLFSSANNELANISDWFRANKLTLNISKTKFILFRDKHQISDLSNHNLFIDNKMIDRIGYGCNEESFKFVGLYLDEFLSWKFHIQHVYNKTASAVYTLSKVRTLLPNHIKYTIYNSLFRSHIEYGINCWGKAKSPEIKRIITHQKRACRHIDNVKYNAHTDKIFVKYRILRFHDLVDFNHACFMFKYVNDKLPNSFNELFSKLNNFERTLSFRTMDINKNPLKLFPSFTLVKLWNSLSLDLKRSSSLNVFKQKFNKKLFENYQTVCTKNNCYACRT